MKINELVLTCIIDIFMLLVLNKHDSVFEVESRWVEYKHIKKNYAYREFYWDENVQCEKGLEGMINDTLSMAIIGNDLYQYRFDHKIVVFPNVLTNRFDQYRHQLYLMDCKVISDEKYYHEIANYWPLNQLKNQYETELWQIQDLIRQQVRTTLTKDKTENHNGPWNENSFMLHFYIVGNKNRTLHYHGVYYESRVYEYWRHMITESGITIINLSVNGNLYQLITYYEKVNSDYNNNEILEAEKEPRKILVFKTVVSFQPYARICLKPERPRHIYLQKNLLTRCKSADKLFERIEFGFVIENNLYFFSISSKQLFYVNKSFLTEMDQEFFVQYLDFTKFFRCNVMSHRLQEPLSKSKFGGNPSKTLTLNSLKIYSKKLPKKPDPLKAILKILIGLKYFGLLSYYIFAFCIFKKDQSISDEDTI